MPQDQVTSAATPVPTRTGTLEHETYRLNETLTELRDLIDSLAADLSPVLLLDPPVAGETAEIKAPTLVDAVEKIAVLERGARNMVNVVRSIRNRLQLS